jgi:hypothetical protein
MEKQCREICQSEDTIELDVLYQIIHPLEYIYTRIPQSKYSVSKLKPASNHFYDFLEIVYSLSLFDCFHNFNVKTLHVGDTGQNTVECFNMFREFYHDQHFSLKDLDSLHDNHDGNNNYDFIFMEYTDAHAEGAEGAETQYIVWFIKALYNLLLHQKQYGVAILKVNELVYKPILDILFILSGCYEKVFLIKPNTSNIIFTEKYIVCKKMNIINQSLSCLYLLNTLEKLLDEINALGDVSYVLSSILKNDFPCFFLSKMEEFNVIIGQQQLSALDMVINIVKGKNREEKMETIKKAHIQKCIEWCDKYKIPNNKFNDKVNIFLHKGSGSGTAGSAVA